MKRYAVCSEGLPEGAAKALSAGYEVILLPPHPALASPVASHADMVFRVLDDSVFFDKIYAKRYPDVVAKIARSGGFKVVITDDVPGEEYPADVKFNVLAGEGFAAAKRGAVSRDLLSAVESSGRKFIPVNQGYSACSCLLANGALITADRGITSALGEYADALLISPGHISLPPYNEGFIGGASGFDGERVYFVGDVMTHPDGERIVSHLAAHGVPSVSLTDGELFDVGGIVFI
ncbi:MAG: hypothetical protein IJS45_09935 [Clostridia bacterium]|nr:hypothetical protein [Clostridia bacterium]